MDAIFSQHGDKPWFQQGLGGEYLPRMVTSQQVRAALRQLRTDAKMEPDEFADEAQVNRATVYRIEQMDRDYSPRIETISALVESRGLTLTAFFATIEKAAAAVSPATDAETTAQVRSFLALPEKARAWLLTAPPEFLALIAPSTGESTPAPLAEANTKVARGRRR